MKINYRNRLVLVVLLTVVSIASVLGLNWLSIEQPAIIGKEVVDHSFQNNKRFMGETAYYYSKGDVALYLHLYSKLPPNYITKEDAVAQGWAASKGNLWEVTREKVIGGDRFWNREGLLPAKEGRLFYECDVNYYGGFRGPEKIVYSNDGLIYFTNDHYQSFELLYWEKE